MGHGWQWPGNGSGPHIGCGWFAGYRWVETTFPGPCTPAFPVSEMALSQAESAVSNP